MMQRRCEAYAEREPYTISVVPIGEKSYGVTDNKDFHFAKATQDYENGIYLSVDATEDKCVITAYDGDSVYDEFTKVNGCYNKDTFKKFEHEFTTYSNGMVICEKCGVRENVETEKFNGLVKDENLENQCSLLMVKHRQV